MTFQQLISFLESFAPLHFQESYDNSGLLVGEPTTEITGVLVALDTIEAVLEEAIAKKCNLIVAHHPIIFKGMKRFTGSNYVERTVMKAIRKGIGIYAIHTNLDNVREGVNAKIAKKLRLQNLHILASKPNLIHQNNAVGSGIIGELAKPLSATDFLIYLKESMNLPLIKYTALLDKPIQKVAVCGGAGSFLLSHALAAKADVFITADYKYHEFFDAENRIIICDIGHYESEVFTKNLLADLLRKEFPSLSVQICETNTNPVQYFV